MKCTISNRKNGTIYSYGKTESNKEILVLSGHLFYDKKVEVEKYNDKFYIVKRLNYNEETVLKKHVDEDGLIDFNLLKEDSYVSKPYKRIYELDGYWFFVPKILTNLVEYLYENKLTGESRIRITQKHTTHKDRAPIINVNYERLFQLLTKCKKPVNAHFYCDRNKNYSESIYADFYALGVIKNKELQLELWEIIADGQELFYSHFIQDIESDLFKHFDLATHVKDPSSNIEGLLKHKVKPMIVEKIKWFRNDSNLSKEQIFDITKLFFPLENLIDEFFIKNYG